LAQATASHSSTTAGNTTSTLSHAGQANTLRTGAEKKCDGDDMKNPSLQSADLPAWSCRNNATRLRYILMQLNCINGKI
jgi:hypothetical protein